MMKQGPIPDRNAHFLTREILQSHYLKEGHILHLLPFAVYVCDKTGSIVHYNHKAVQLWDREPDKEDPKERFCGAYKLYFMDGKRMHPQETPIAGCLADGLPRESAELIMERPDGTCIITRMNIVPIKDELGNILGSINCFEDITEQKGIQKELDWKTKQLQDYVENASIGLHWVDENGIIKWANKAELDMLGYTEKEYIGHHISEFHVQKEKINDILKRLSCNEMLDQYESELRCKDGSIKVVHISSNVFWDEGKFIHTRCFTVDVTPQKRMFDKLKASEAKYRELADTLERKVEEKTSDLKNKNEELQKSEDRYHKMVEEVEDYAIILLDKEGIVQNWNRGAEKIKGYTEEEIVGKSFTIFYLPQDRENGLPYKLLSEAREKGKAIHEGWRMKKNGSRFWGSIVLTALHNENGEVIGFSKVTRDLTERKLAEDRLKEYNNRLEFQNRELEQFTFAASHDMKEPLRKIHLYNSSVLENPINVLDKRSKEFLERSLQAAKRMTSLIDDLLAYSRMASSIEAFSLVDIKEIVDEVLLTHREEIEHNRIMVKMDSLPVVYAVPFQIKQLMDNIIGNAIKYKHPERDGFIHISSEQVSGKDLTMFNADTFKDYYKISISDNGVGFANEYAERIFDIFQRLNNLPGALGSGIGLAICKRIIQNHQGFIKATGVQNKGTKIEFFLPKVK
jgi:PAS domain S-box-containing protein